MYFSTMHADAHIASPRVAVPSLRKDGVERAVSRLHILILLINLIVALSLIILS